MFLGTHPVNGNVYLHYLGVLQKWLWTAMNGNKSAFLKFSDATANLSDGAK
jgi:hypothetical protein